MEKTKVSIVKTDCYDEKQIHEAVRKAVELAGGMENTIRPGWKVIVKPNFAAIPRERLSGAITRWEVTKAVCDLVKEAGGIPVIAESSAAGVDTEKVIEFTGYDKLPEGVDPKDIVLIGKCTVKLKDQATHVMGCPPNNIFVERGISGVEDVKRRYSTEGDVD